METIRNIINKNNHDDLCLLGDINCYFLRKTGHVSAVVRFIDSMTLVRSWKQFSVDFTHCHEMDGRTFTSTLDHFFWSEEISRKVSEAGVIHLPCNLSDHEPIFCVMKVEPSHHIPTSAQSNSLPRPSWKRATEEN